MRNMGGLRRYMPVTALTMWIATLAISGIWPFAGFFSKDEIIWYAGAAAAGPHAAFYRVYWIVALAAAMLTAFYMTRMMVMTFHGANRTGAAEASHLHEAPLTMTVPLTILAFLSMFGGWINVPEAMRESFFGLFGALPMSEWLHHWLEPVTQGAVDIRAAHVGEFLHHAPFGGGEVAWGLASTLAAAVVVALAAMVVGRRSFVPATDDRAPTGIRRILYNKWYVDELYDLVVVRPVVRTSRALWKVADEIVIDGTVNALGGVTRAVGWVGSLFQTGSVNTYALVLTLGVLVILGVVAF
jgi:NADH-quinone oxidoreductase subunit L